MSYLVLARKCRPQTFDEVVAQGHITDTLKSALEKDRLAHAYLFCGPRGTGKTTTARILAKALNCESSDKPTSTPCGKCGSCIAIAGGHSPDVLEIDGASNRGIAEIQALRERVQYAPAGRYKIFIIDEVHMLTKEAFNALLKTLEEPPSYITFIFATTEPQKLPPTITSRCQRFDFRRIPSTQITEQIVAISREEGLLLSEDAAALIAHRADGSLRDSLSLLDQILAYSPKGELSVEEVARILGILPIDAFRSIADKVVNRDPAGAVRELDSLLESGIDIGQVAEGLVEHFHGAVMGAIGALPEDIGEKQSAAYNELAESVATEDLLRIAKLSADIQAKIKTAPQPRFLFEEMLIYLCSFDKTTDVRAVLSNSPAQSRPQTEAPVPRPPSKEALHEEPEQESESLSTGNREHDRLIDLFEKSRGEGKADMLRHAELIPDEKRIVLKFPHSFDFQVNNILTIRDNFDALKVAAEEVYGKGINIKLLVEDPPTKEGSETNPRKGMPDNVQDILKAFDAKLEE